MKTHIVWIYGTSASGKETFIRYCSGKQSPILFATLGWTGREIVPCLESIDWVVQKSDDGFAEKRRALLDVIPAMAHNHPGALILVKGQDLDLQTHRVHELHEGLSDCMHEIIFLDGDLDQQFERWKQKPWYVDHYSRETVANHIKYQVMYLESTNLPVRSLYAKEISEYELVPFPPT